MKKSGGRYTRYKVSYSWEGDCEMGENKMPHIQLPENLGIRYAVLPGDPARAERAAGYLKDAKLLTFNREYKSYSGFWNGVPVLVMSTGMGGPSMAIAVEELIRELNALGEAVIFLGDGVTVYQEMLKENMQVPYSFAPAHLNKQRAGAVGALAEKYYREGKTVTAAEHQPEYLRVSQAERERAEREAGKK